MNGKGDAWRVGWTKKYESNFNKLFKKERDMDAIIKDALYQFVQFYKQDEFDQLDMMLIVDRFLEDEYDKGKR